MNLKEKRREELEQTKKGRIAIILQAAFELFSVDGIDSITMNDIARKAEIGVASLYRYFTTKEELAIQCATMAWDKIRVGLGESFGEADYDELAGITQLNIIFDIFCDLYASNKQFFRFIYFFDSFIVRSNISSDSLSMYESEIQKAKDIITEAIKKGFEDGSICQTVTGSNVDLLYFTITHSLFALAQKLSLSGNMLKMDKEISDVRQLKMLADMLLESLIDGHATVLEE